MLQNRIIPTALRKEILKKYKPECYWCGKKGFRSKESDKPCVLEKETYKCWTNEYDGTYILKNRAMDFDHIKPISKGGETSVDNLIIACRYCNRSRGANEVV